MDGLSMTQLEGIWFWKGPVDQYYVPSQRWRMSRELTLWHLQRGEVTLFSRSGRRQVPASHWIVPPPLHRRELFSADAVVRSLRFTLCDGDGRMVLSPAEPLVLPRQQGGALDASLLAVETFLAEVLEQDIHRKVMLRELALSHSMGLRLHARLCDCVGDLLEAVMRLPEARALDVSLHPAVSTALNHLQERDPCEPLKETDVATVAGVSLPHLSRLFREQTGFSIKHWHEQRIECSVKHDLRHGHLSGKEIAARHGFSSASHFSRWFRDRVGAPPREWVSRGAQDDIP